MNEVADLGREIEGSAEFCSVNSMFPIGFSTACPFDISAFPLHPVTSTPWVLDGCFLKVCFLMILLLQYLL